MSRASAITGLVLALIGAAIFATKAFVLGVPLAPSDVKDLWQVSLRVTVRGEGRRGSISILMPRTGDGQTILDEATSSGALDHTSRTTDDGRVGVWTGRFEGLHEIRHRFRVKTVDVTIPLPGRTTARPPEDVERAWARGTVMYPTTAPQIVAALDELSLPGNGDVVGRVRTIFAFVQHEVALVRTAADDAVLALEQREGSREGKERLLVTMLRAAGVPARNARGLVLNEKSAPAERVWTQAWIDGAWVPMSTVDGFFGHRPASLILFGTGEQRVIDATDLRAVAYRYESLREHLQPGEVASVMTPDSGLLRLFSLYRLPLATQAALRHLLLLPIGALVIALFRNVIGLQTFGTFMPILISFALRGMPLAAGLVLVGFVLGVGVLARLALERLRLLLVPRLALLLCLVVLSVTTVAVIGQSTEQNELFKGVLFPMIILTMLVERFTIAIAEEGWKPALTKAGYSVLAIMAVYPLFNSIVIEHLMFSFPELTLVIMGCLVWIGGYMGYRLTDITRFRAILSPQPPEQPS
ncbi:MAG: UUP1 family membrane protein [Acidobacteriota bacterium]|nr:MAG: UUP1 family membrane protein [Acidobacteriota bacterium]